MKELVNNQLCKTFKVKSEFYITTTQFQTPEELNKFVLELLQSLDGPEYKTYCPHGMTQTESRY